MHPYQHSILDMPVSLEKHTVRTAAFAPSAATYWILMQFEKSLPFQQLQCMIGATSGGLDSADCTSDALLRTNWTVYSDERIVSQGASTTTGHGGFAAKYMVKFLGSFSTQPGHTYVVEVTFTEDETPLNVTNPHLVIVKQGLE